MHHSRLFPGTTRPRRRDLLTLGLLGAAAVSLGGCGRLQVGSPQEYTPPPLGIDDIYRADLLAQVERLIAAVTAIGSTVPAPAAATLVQITAALPVQRQALLTGAEAEADAEAKASAAKGETSDATDSPIPSAPPTDLPTDVAGLIAEIVALRELCTDAARQVSGRLARPVCAIGAYAAWAASRLHAQTKQGSVPAIRPVEKIVPSHTVPTDDPPSIGAASDYTHTLSEAQREEWYTAYLLEVIAARRPAEEHESRAQVVQEHRDRAQQLGKIAEEDKAPVVVREAVYPLPQGGLDDRALSTIPVEAGKSLMQAYIAMAGAAPFERRSIAIHAALVEASRLGPVLAELAPLPTLEPEAAPAAG